jgi:ArsR family transcriptional regulator
MSDTESPTDAAYTALDRLYDDADERVATLEALRPDRTTVTRQQEVFKALGNEDRLRILTALRECECCVCELQIVIDAPQSTVATHLRTLKDAGLVRSRKKGKWSYYRIADTAVFDLLDLAHAVGGATDI